MPLIAYIFVEIKLLIFKFTKYYVIQHRKLNIPIKPMHCTIVLNFIVKIIKLDQKILIIMLYL